MKESLKQQQQKLETSVFNTLMRWEQESDLDDIGLAEGAMKGINKFLNDEGSVFFEPDPSFFDQTEPEGGDDV
tara:strand:+ start:658 stop:876 length:219 start_codon:yes stop_codon:yes gene_type:complete